MRLKLTTEEPARLPAAASVLGPLNPIHLDGTLAFYVLHAAGSGGPEAAKRLFARLDEQRIWCTLSREEVREAAPVEEAPRRSVATSWADVLATLPRDWSELLCRLEIEGSDLLPRAALLCAPINPSRDRDSVGFLFRAGRHRLRRLDGDGDALLRAARRGRYRRLGDGAPHALGHAARSRPRALPGSSPGRTPVGAEGLAIWPDPSPGRSAREDPVRPDGQTLGPQLASEGLREDPTMRVLIAAASSSDSVRSGDWKTRCIATDFFPAPACSPR